MELQVAVAKVPKYAVIESGDTVEMIERPHGGISFVMVDGQHTGRGAKAVSILVARKAISLLAEGVRDGAAARAAHDYLYTLHDGKVSAELQIVSLDLVSGTIVISRNTRCPAVVGDASGVRLLGLPSEPIGVHLRMKPIISEMVLAPNVTVVVFTDGVMNAGVRYGQTFDTAGFVQSALLDESISAQVLADAILAKAKESDRGRPGDDTSVLAVRVVPSTSHDDARRLTLSFPID
jgi:serine phosphatase RsbU (regulator of sigma subunit)